MLDIVGGALDAEIRQLEDELADLKSRSSRGYSEAHLQSQVNQAQLEAIGLRQELSLASARAEACQAELDSQQQSMEELSNRCSQWAQEVETTSVDNARLRSQVDSTRVAAVRRAEESEENEHSGKLLRAALSTLSKEAGRAVEDVRAMGADLADERSRAAVHAYGGLERLQPLHDGLAYQLHGLASAVDVLEARPLRNGATRDALGLERLSSLLALSAGVIDADILQPASPAKADGTAADGTAAATTTTSSAASTRALQRQLVQLQLRLSLDDAGTSPPWLGGAAGGALPGDLLGLMGSPTGALSAAALSPRAATAAAAGGGAPGGAAEPPPSPSGSLSDQLSSLALLPSAERELSAMREALVAERGAGEAARREATRERAAAARRAHEAESARKQRATSLAALEREQQQLRRERDASVAREREYQTLEREHTELQRRLEAAQAALARGAREHEETLARERGRFAAAVAEERNDRHRTSTEEPGEALRKARFLEERKAR